MKKNILITGVGGTIGSNLLKYIVDGGDYGCIKGIDNNENAVFLENKKYNNDQIEISYGDICDGNYLTNKLKGIDIVYHCLLMILNSVNQILKLQRKNLNGGQR
jgi:FlaA1/EpsC-like NDP-sugar epimerase